MKNIKQEIPEWENITDYRPFIKEGYVFNFKSIGSGEEVLKAYDKSVQDTVSHNYANEVVNDPCNSKWIERRKISEAFKMGIEFSNRFLNGG